MASADDAAANASSAGSGLGRPLIIAATFAAGVAAALAAKSVLDSRSKGRALAAAPGGESEEDLATTLRRAALDVAIAATNEAAERLSVEEQDREPAEQR